MESRIEAERSAREDAERRARELANDDSEAARRALADAERKAEQARKIREEAEARLEEEKRAREQMEARMAREGTVRAKLIARMEDERRARAAAEDRAKMEAVARVMQQREYQEKSATEIQQRVEGELQARRQAEFDAEVRARKEAAERAKAAAEIRARIAEEEAARAAAAQPEKPRKVLLPMGIAALLLIGFALALLEFMPLTPWVRNVERIASERLGETVTVSKMHYSLFPSPALTLEGVAVGAQQDIRIPSVQAAIGIADLLSAQKTISTLQLQSPVLDQDGLARVLAWIRPSASAQQTPIERVIVRGARVSLPGMEPLHLDADVTLGSDGALTKAALSLSDGSLRAEVVPHESHAAVQLRGSRFIPPIGPAYVFEDLEATASVTRSGLQDVQAQGTLFGGKFKADGQARFDNGIAVEGRFAIDNLELEPLIALFARGVSVTGTADMTGTFALQTERMEHLFDRPRVQASFSGQRGTVNNVDLVRAAQVSGREGVRGGRTRYNTLTGAFTVAGDQAYFQQLRIQSDGMSAAGGFEVRRGGDLAGQLGIQVGPRGTVVARGNVGVSGDVRNPVLR
jgi:hypothetical protein